MKVNKNADYAFRFYLSCIVINFVNVFRVTASRNRSPASFHRVWDWYYFTFMFHQTGNDHDSATFIEWRLFACSDSCEAHR